MPKTTVHPKKVKLTVSLHPSTHRCLQRDAARTGVSATVYCAVVVDQRLRGEAVLPPGFAVKNPGEYLRADGIRISVFLGTGIAERLSRHGWKNKDALRPSDAQIVARWITEHFTRKTTAA